MFWYEVGGMVLVGVGFLCVWYKLWQYSQCLKAYGRHLAELDDAVTDPRLWRVRK